MIIEFELEPASDQPENMLVGVIKSDFIEIGGWLTIVLRNWHFKPLYNFLFVGSLNFFLNTLDFMKICGPFEKILPLVVKALNC